MKLKYNAEVTQISVPAASNLQRFQKKMLNMQSKQSTDCSVFSEKDVASPKQFANYSGAAFDDSLSSSAAESERWGVIFEVFVGDPSPSILAAHPPTPYASLSCV